MAKITERSKESSKTAELPAAELTSLAGRFLARDAQGSLGLKQSYASFFKNIALTLQTVTIASSEASIVNADKYSFTFANEENIFFLAEENKEFFRKIIASQYKGKVAEVVSQYFLRKTCSIFAVLAGKELDATFCSFQGSNATAGNYKHQNWTLSFHFEYDKFSLTIGAAPALQDLLQRLSSNEIAE